MLQVRLLPRALRHLHRLRAVCITEFGCQKYRFNDLSQVKRKIDLVTPSQSPQTNFSIVLVRLLNVTRLK